MPVVLIGHTKKLFSVKKSLETFEAPFNRFFSSTNLQSIQGLVWFIFLQFISSLFSFLIITIYYYKSYVFYCAFTLHSKKEQYCLIICCYVWFMQHKRIDLLLSFDFLLVFECIFTFELQLASRFIYRYYYCLSTYNINI